MISPVIFDSPSRQFHLDDLTVEAGQIGAVRWTNHSVHADDRGSFSEAYRESWARVLVSNYIVQTNVSLSKRMALRGFHWHEAQTDFWFIASGMAQVVVGVSNRYESRVLTQGQGLIIPPKVAHGFLALFDLVLIYGVTQEYNRREPDEHGFSATEYPEWLVPVENTIRSDRDIGYDDGKGDWKPGSW